MNNSNNTETTENTSTNHDNTINFMYFINNYPRNFIYEVWDGSIADHFQSKFLGLCTRYEKSNLAFLYWFHELDNENQNILLNWTNENYKAFKHLKI